MKKFVVGYLNFFDNDLFMEVVSASSYEEAIMNCSYIKGFDFPEGSTFENMKDILFNCDIAVSAIEINLNLEGNHL